jgi:hypothetical protein
MLYIVIRKAHQEHESNQQNVFEHPIPGIDKILKNFTLGLGIISLMVAFGYGMQGEAVQTNISNYTIGTFNSNITVMNGVLGAPVNYTNQTLPVVTGLVRTTTITYTTGQTNFNNGIYAVTQLVLYFIGLLLAIVYIIRYFGLLKDARLKPKRGWNG